MAFQVAVSESLVNAGEVELNIAVDAAEGLLRVVIVETLTTKEVELIRVAVESQLLVLEHILILLLLFVGRNDHDLGLLSFDVRMDIVHEVPSLSNLLLLLLHLLDNLGLSFWLSRRLSSSGNGFVGAGHACVAHIRAFCFLITLDTIECQVYHRIELRVVLHESHDLVVRHLDELAKNLRCELNADNLLDWLVQQAAELALVFLATADHGIANGFQACGVCLGV